MFICFSFQISKYIISQIKHVVKYLPYPVGTYPLRWRRGLLKCVSILKGERWTYPYTIYIYY
nr:MAG TPA: hypothetical protein [Caudoviricetes sp.]